MRRSWKELVERGLHAMVPIDGDPGAAGAARRRARPGALGRLEAGSQETVRHGLGGRPVGVTPWVERELDLPPPAA